jgi:hypothetical protein
MANNADQFIEEFEYLDALRESGITNMWGAAVFVQAQFGLDRKPAVDILLKWMKTFDQRQEERQERHEEQAQKYGLGEPLRGADEEAY